MTAGPTIYVVDDDEAVRDSVQMLLESFGLTVEPYPSAPAFIAGYKEGRPGCVIADIRMPEMDGLELQEEMTRRKIALPVIFVTGHGDVPLAVRAMKAGSVDFLEKPFDEATLMASVRRALALAQESRHAAAEQRAAAERVAQLTEREQQVLAQLVAGRPNKVIAFKLDISPRTVEVHRARVMEKLQVRSLSDLVRTALAANIPPAQD